MLRTAHSRAATAALFVLMTLAPAHAQPAQPEAGPGGARVIPLPSRDTRGTVPPPPSQAPPPPQGAAAEPSDRAARQDDPPDFGPGHRRRNSLREEREYERERWREQRDMRRRERETERQERRRDDPRPARQPNSAAAAQAERPGADFGAAAGATPIWLDRACAPDRDQRVAAYLAAIEQRTTPSGNQLQQLEALKKAANAAGELLRGVCDVTPALTPTRQIEVVERRAKAVLSAINVLKPALDTFYAALDDEQKARYNAIPTAPAAASPAAPQARPQANSEPTDRVGTLQRTYGDGPGSESEAGGASEEASEPRRKSRRWRRYRYYYRW